MNISTKSILSSAEGIIRDRHDDARRPAASPLANEPAKAVTSGNSLGTDSLHARLLDLQANLNRTQREFSREQTRKHYLTDGSRQLDSTLRFEGELLFPELQKGNPLPEQLLSRTDERMSELSRKLKGLQVEMENVMALNFQAPASRGITAEDLHTGTMKELDPARVARLTRP